MNLTKRNKVEMSDMKNLTVIDLFCGAGGLSYGFQQAGFNIIAGLDNNKYAELTYIKNFPKAKFYSEKIENVKPGIVMADLGLKPEELDCLIGGPPCQGFSVKGNRYLNDPRNQLFKYFMDFVYALKPKVVLIENVPPIMTLGDEKFQDKFFHHFRRYGYKMHCNKLIAAEYGVPQIRKRAFFIALRNHKYPTLPSPTYAMTKKDNNSSLPECPKVIDAIGDLPPLKMKQRMDHYVKDPISEYQKLMRKDQTKLYNHEAKLENAINIERMQKLCQGQSMRDLPKQLQAKSGFSQAYGRLSNKGLACTITANMHNLGSGRYIHPTQDRAITAREAARLQSFDDKFIFYGSMHSQCRQIGNAVPPLLAQAIALHIKNDLL